jgi:hypothetical protein
MQNYNIYQEEDLKAPEIDFKPDWNTNGIFVKLYGNQNKLASMRKSPRYRSPIGISMAKSPRSPHTPASNRNGAITPNNDDYLSRISKPGRNNSNLGGGMH